MREHAIEKSQPLQLSSLAEGIMTKYRDHLNKKTDLKDSDKGGQNERHQAISKVIDKLNLKERDIEDQLKSESDPKKRKRLETKLKVTRLQIEKGLSAVNGGR